MHPASQLSANPKGVAPGMEEAGHEPERSHFAVVEEVGSRFEEVNAPAIVADMKQQRIRLQDRDDTIMLIHDLLRFRDREQAMIVVDGLEVLRDDPRRVLSGLLTSSAGRELGPG